MAIPRVPNSKNAATANQVLTLQEEIKDLEAQLDAKNIRIQELEAALIENDNSNEMAKLRSEVEKLKAELLKVNKALEVANKYKEENEESQREIDELKAIIESMEASAAASAELDQSQKETIEILNQTIIEAEEKLRMVEEEQAKEVKSLNTKNKTLQTNLSKKKEELKEVLAEVETLKKSLSDYEKEIRRLKVEVTASKGVAEVNKRLTKIAEGHSRASDYLLGREAEKHAKATEQVRQKSLKIKEQEKEIKDKESLIAEEASRASKAERKFAETAYKFEKTERKLQGATSKIAGIKAQAKEDVAKADQEKQAAIAEKNEAVKKAEDLVSDNAKMAAEAGDIDLFNATYKIILEEFNKQYPKIIDLDKAEKADKANGDLYRVVKTAKKKKNEKSYDSILADVVARYEELITKSSEKSKQNFASDKRIKGIAIEEGNKVCERVVDYYSSKHKANVKKGIVATLAAAAVIVGVGIFAFANQNGQIVTLEKDLGDANNTISTTQKELDSTQNDLTIEEANGIVEKTVGNYNAIERDHGYALVINEFYGNKAKSGMAAASEASDFNTIVNAQARANEIVAFDEEGNVSEDCQLGKAVSDYAEAVKAGDQEKIDSCSAEIIGYQETMSSLASDTNVALNGMLDKAGITINDLRVLMDILNEPTVSLKDTDFSATQKEEFDVGTRKAVDKVLYCKYDKSTGKVNLLLECSDFAGRVTKSHFEYLMTSELKTVDSEAIIDGYKTAYANKKVSVADFESLETTIDGATVTLNGVTGTVELGASVIAPTTDSVWRKVSGKALIVVKDDAGEVVELKVVSAEGIRCKASEVAEKKADVVETLISKINAELGTSAQLAEDGIENE